MLLLPRTLRRLQKRRAFHSLKKNLQFIEEKLSDFIGDKWYDAVLYALNELQRKI